MKYVTLGQCAVSRKSQEKCTKKKEKKIGGGRCPPGKCTVFGGGKCPSFGVVNVRILGVVNALLANDSQSFWLYLLKLMCTC